MNSQRAYLLHALDAIDAITEYTQDGRDAFFADRKTQDAVIRNVEVLGQAVKGLSAETRARDDSIRWRQIAGMRDKLIHEYFGVDLTLVWDVVEREPPHCVPGSPRCWKASSNSPDRPDISLVAKAMARFGVSSMTNAAA